MPHVNCPLFRLQDPFRYDPMPLPSDEQCSASGAKRRRRSGGSRPRPPAQQVSAFSQHCLDCGASKSSMWRRGPAGRRVLSLALRSSPSASFLTPSSSLHIFSSADALQCLWNPPFQRGEEVGQSGNARDAAQRDGGYGVGP